MQESGTMQAHTPLGPGRALLGRAASPIRKHAAPRSDIIELVLAEHRRIRRLMDVFDNAAARQREAFGMDHLATVWQRVAEVIELHIDAEQEICYLPVFGTSQDGLAQMNDAIADHNDIREALREARLYGVASPVWWLAVTDAMRTCRRHLACYEDGPLAGFTRRADPKLRNELGRQWTAFAAARAREAQPGNTSPGSDPEHTPVTRCPGAR